MTQKKCICTPHELLEQYKKNKTTIKDRLKEFRNMMKCSDETIFSELVFCLFTPQSSAKKCDHAVRRLIDLNLLLEGTPTDIAKEIKGVRFHNTKSARVLTARNLFTENKRIIIKKIIHSYNNNYELREWLIKNVNGLGYKESSHFLRNIGLGFDMAILDRHILNNLKALDIIDCVPKSISKSRYLSIEKKLIGFSKKIGLTPAELDLLLWSKETGEVFK